MHENGPHRRRRWRTATSLRSRLLLGLGAVLLPFMVAAGVGMFYLMPALTAPLDAMMSEVSDEMEPLRRLQLGLLTASVVAQGRAVGASKDFPQTQRRVDQAFNLVRATPAWNAEERELIEAAWREWDGVRNLRVGAPRASEIAVHAEAAVAILDAVYAPAQRELDHLRRRAGAARTRSLATTWLAFLAALAISLYVAVRLARPVVVDVEALREGAARLARGELSHRVAQPSTEEMSEVAAAFNAMAQRIEAEQAALADLAMRDGLTGLLNRRELLRLLGEELRRAQRYGHSFSLLLIDLDRFKSVNDTWGHPAGDAVLRATAERIAAGLRPSDRAARYGGEEFAVLLPETARAGAVAAAERIRAAIAGTPVPISAERAIGVTSSIGVASYPDDGTGEQALVGAADKALYAAKQAGRDRVVASAPSTR